MQNFVIFCTLLPLEDVTEDIFDVAVTQSEITDTNASINIETKSSFTKVTDNDLDLSSGESGSCSVANQTYQSIRMDCTNLSNGTAYNLTVIVSVGNSSDVIILISFETNATGTYY